MLKTTLQRVISASLFIAFFSACSTPQYSRRYERYRSDSVRAAPSGNAYDRIPVNQDERRDDLIKKQLSFFAILGGLILLPELIAGAAEFGAVAELGTAAEVSEVSEAAAATRSVSATRSLVTAETGESLAITRARVVAELDAAEAEEAGSRVYAIGKHEDTARVAGWWNRGYRRLAIPQTDWTLEKNDAWIGEIIDSRSKVYVASRPTRTVTWDAVKRQSTTFGREIKQLESANYRWSGDFLLPPMK